MLRFLSLLCVLTLFACTPKPTEPVEEEVVTAPTPPPPPVDEKLSPCQKFTDAPNPNEAETKYVLYRDQFKLAAPDMDRAFELWQYVYANAPAADGRRNTVYSDGIYFYEYFISQTTDTVQQKQYADRIFEIYEEIDKCYPEGGYVQGRMAFDYYYKYPQRATDMEKWKMFKESMDTDGMKTQDFVLNPMTDLTVRMHNAGEITDEQAKTVVATINARLAKGLQDCQKTRDCDRWTIIKGYVPERLEYFETVRGFYDCQYYVDKYYPEFEANQSDCDVITTVGSRLTFGGCSKNSPEYLRLEQAYRDQKCGGDPGTPSGPISIGYDHLRNARYDEAIESFKQGLEEATDPQKKGQIALLIGKVYYAHKKNFSQGRNWAEQAADYRTNWGEPYILIGRMYASSGPLCGSGRGWNSQVVVWPAIDAWNKAKSVDPSVAGEANKWIRQYSQYMPSKEDIFQRSLNVGDRYTVPCWIQRSTTIRAAN